MKRFAATMACICYLMALSGQTRDISFLKKKINHYMDSKPDSALWYVSLFDSATKEGGLKEHQIKSLYYKGRIYFRRNEVAKSLKVLFQALEMCDSNTPDRIRGEIEFQIGWENMMETNNFKTAIHYFLQARKHFMLINDSTELFRSLSNIIQCYDRMGQFDSSQTYVEQAQQIENGRLPHDKAHFYTIRGSGFLSLFLINHDSTLLDSSLKYYLRGLAISGQDPSFTVEDRVALQTNIGSVYYSQRKPEDALEYLLAATRMFDKLKNNTIRLPTYVNAAMIYYDIKDYKNCSDFLWKYLDWMDTLEIQKKKAFADELDAKYKMEQEVFKNEIVQKQEALIVEKTAQIRAQNNRIYLYSGLFILIILVLVVWLIYFRLKNNSQILINQAKKRFFINVIHEIRTPLSMIQAPIKLLKVKSRSAEDMQNIELAERNVDRLNELITQMLDITKLDQEKYFLKESIGDLELFFQTIVSPYAKTALEKNIALIPEIHLISKYAIFDKDAIQKITGNLLDNAIKYTPSNNQVGITVNSEEQENGIRLVIRVWDTGPGIRAEDRERIFGRFERASSSEHIKGMGIGLSLVKELVDLMHGEMYLISNEGQGSCFEVSLLLKPYSQVPLESMKDVPYASDKSQILLVEDDPEIMDFNTRYLESNNFHVLRAEHGKAALKILEMNIPDIIVTDLMMSELDGLGFIKKIKSNPTTEHIPIIVLSAKTSPDSRIEAIQAGAQGFISKPFLPEELVSTVQSQIDIIRSRREDFKKQIEKPTETIEQKFKNSDPYLQKLFVFVMANLGDEEFSVEKLADLMATNRSHFQRKVKALCGLSPSEIIRIVRLEKAREMILSKKSNINEVAYQTGFSSHSYFTKCFTQYFGVSPVKVLHGNS